jgi:hypothetical protein
VFCIPKNPPGPGVHAAVGGPGDLHVLGADLAGQGQAALDHHVEAGRRIALVVDRAGLEVLDVPVLAQPFQLLVLKLLEQEQRAQLGDVTRQMSHVRSR